MSAEDKKDDTTAMPTDVVRAEGLMPEVGASAEVIEYAPPDDKKKKGVSDKMLYVATSLMTHVLRVGTVLLMARKLTPADFGLVSMVIIVPGYLACFGDFGISRSLVQFRDDDRREVEDSAFVITLLTGGIVWVAMTISGVVFWMIRNDLNLFAVGFLSGLTVMLSYIYQFQMACMNRDMKFRTEARQNMIFSFTTMTTGVGLAYSGFGLYAVLLQPLVAQIVCNIAIFPAHPLRFPRALTKKRIKGLLTYGGKVTVAGFLGNLQGTVAGSVVSWRWREVGLGVYGRAAQVRDMAGQNIAAALDRMLYPLMRAVRDDQDRLRHLFLRGAFAVALLCFFGWAALTAISPEIIYVVMGPQWDQVGSMLRWLAPALFYLPLLVPSVALANAMGNMRVWVISSAIGLAGVTVGMLIGQIWGLEGAVAGMTIGQAFLLYSTHWAMKVTKTRRRMLAKRLLSIFIAGILSCVAMLSMRMWMAHFSTGVWEMDPNPKSISIPRHILNIGAVMGVGTSVYFSVCWLLCREAMREMIDMVRKRKG